MKYALFVLICSTLASSIGPDAKDNKKTIESVIHSLKSGDTFESVYAKIKTYPHRIGDYPSLLCYDEKKGEYLLLFGRSQDTPSSKFPVVVVIFFANGKADYDTNGVVVLPVEWKGKKLGLKDLQKEGK
jgi:hypothetical protein